MLGLPPKPPLSHQGELTALAACHAAVMFIASAAVKSLKLQEQVLPQLLAFEGFKESSVLWKAIKGHLGRALCFESVGLTSELVSFSPDTDAFRAVYEAYLKAPISREWQERLQEHFYMPSHRGGCFVTDYEYQCLKSAVPSERVIAQQHVGYMDI